MSLLKEKHISAITVKELCEHADINRSTFYAHYADHYDLLSKIEDEIIEDMHNYLSLSNFKKEEESLQMTIKLLEYLATKQDECQTLLNENSESSFQKKVKAIAQHFIVKNRIEVNEPDHNLSIYINSFIISGSIEMMKLWMENGMDKSPIEMANIIHNIINKELLGIK